MTDTIVVALLIVAFALVLTMHVVIAFGLARHRPRWRAVVAFVVPPFAPYWAWQEQMRTRASLWIAAAVVYIVMLVLATRGP